MVCDDDGWNIFYIVVNYGYLLILKFILFKGLCLFCRTVDGENVLYIVVSSGYFYIVKYLVECGIGLDA